MEGKRKGAERSSPYNESLHLVFRCVLANPETKQAGVLGNVNTFSFCDPVTPERLIEGRAWAKKEP